MEKQMTEEKETTTGENDKGWLKETINHGLVFTGALAILLLHGYVSSKLLMGLVILDYFTTEYLKKIPTPICFVIFMVLTYLAVA